MLSHYNEIIRKRKEITNGNGKPNVENKILNTKIISLLYVCLYVCKEPGWLMKLFFKTAILQSYVVV